MLCEKDKVVSINYTLKGDDGNIIDSSEGKAPLEYLHGRNYLLPHKLRKNTYIYIPLP